MIVVADRLPAVVAPGEAPRPRRPRRQRPARSPSVRAAVTAELTWPGGHRAWHWGGEVPADSCVRIGTVDAEVPPVPGELVLDLTLTAGEVTATNRYKTVIAP